MEMDLSPLVNCVAVCPPFPLTLMRHRISSNAFQFALSVTMWLLCDEELCRPQQGRRPIVPKSISLDFQEIILSACE